MTAVMNPVRQAVRFVVALPGWLLAGLIVGYRRYITPFTPATCRFYPTCSSYGLTAIRTHGAVKGTVLTGWRVLRCHPWTRGGVDHVPPHGHWRAPADAELDPSAPPVTTDSTAVPTAPPTGA
jgi:putative membrane protein insertion efficiency factor